MAACAIGSPLGGSRAEGVGRLPGLMPLNAAVALMASADMNVELAVDGLARDLDPELLGDVSLVERPAAVGASVWQARLVGFIDLVGLRWRAVGFGAVIFAGPAPASLGLAGGRSLGERGGLALAGAAGLVELAAEPFVLGLSVVAASLEGLAAGTRDGLPTSLQARLGPQRRDHGRRVRISLSWTR